MSWEQAPTSIIVARATMTKFGMGIPNFPCPMGIKLFFPCGIRYGDPYGNSHRNPVGMGMEISLER